MTFTYVDAVVAVIVLLSAFLAYNRGFTREVIAIGGWLVAALAAFYFAPMVEPLMREIPVVGAQLEKSRVISMIAAFTLVVAAGLLVLAVFTPIFASAIQDSVLGPLDRALGFVFGIARGVLLIAVAYLTYGYTSVGEFEQSLEASGTAPAFEIVAVDDAASKTFVHDVAALIDANRPQEMPSWVTDRINALMAPTGDAPSSEASTES